jgi:hypothetical protein
MQINMSKLDRVLRFFVAFLLFMLYYTETVAGTAGLVGLSAATILLGTALVGSCPLYSLLGIRTCPAKP